MPPVNASTPEDADVWNGGVVTPLKDTEEGEYVPKEVCPHETETELRAKPGRLAILNLTT